MFQQLRIHRIVLLGIVAALAMAPPRQATACSCGESPTRVFPVSGDTVPKNAKFWIPAGTASRLVADHLRQLDPLRSKQLDESRWYDPVYPSLSELRAAVALFDGSGNSLPFRVLVLRSGGDGRPRYFILSTDADLPVGHVTLGAVADLRDAVVRVTVRNSRLDTPPSLPTLGVPTVTRSHVSGTCVKGDHFTFPLVDAGIVTVLGLSRRERHQALVGI